MNDRQAERQDRHDDRIADRSSPWDKLGQRWIHGRNDVEVIEVARRERYQRIKLVVEHSEVELYDVVVVFGNGQTFSPGTRMQFAQNSASREIDLPGEARFIQRIELRAGNLPGGGKAQVEVWGLGTRPR